MQNVKRDAYDAAAQRVADGTWTVDPDRGVIIGPTGTPIGILNDAGYLYAQFPHNGRTASVRVHRVIWEAVNGPIRDGMEINHRNAVKGDNRIANLEVVTPRENSQHAIALGLKPDQPTGARGYMARLTEDQAREIKRRAIAGERQDDIARNFGIARSQVSKIRHGRQWRDLVA